MRDMKRNTRSCGLSHELKLEEELLQRRYEGYRGVDDDYRHAGSAALEKLSDWKFGIRIHWGLYSCIGAGRESWPLKSGSPSFRQRYEEIYKNWNPVGFNAMEWMRIFQNAGLKFFTITTKHHEGFSLFDTATRVKRRLVHLGPDAGRTVPCDFRYSVMDTPFKRDIIRELVDAGREAELGIGLYFSHIDWFDSDFRIDDWNYQKDPKYTKESDPEGFRRLVSRHREQLRELCANYGKIDLLSLDMGFPGFDDTAKFHFDGAPHGVTHGIRRELIETTKMLRRLQPDMLIRNRGIDPYGDYISPERVVPTQEEGGGSPLPWKVIYPGGKHFSFQWDDEYKSASWIISNLVDIAAKGGSFQVGYGPRGDGSWDSELVHRLEEVGAWLKVNGEGVYCSRPYKTYSDGENVRYTQSKDGRTVYAFLLKWDENAASIRLRNVNARPDSRIRMLGLDHNFEYYQEDGCLEIKIPSWLSKDRHPCAHDILAFKIEVARC